MKPIRKRLTYANVMSSIAVFLILGGATAVAAKKIGSHQLKASSVTAVKIKRNAVTAKKIRKNAVTTAKIKNDAVTGAKVNESTLEQVPSAANATNAGNATTVNGQSLTKIFAKLGVGQTNVQIASIAGFSITASCPGPVEDLVLHAPGDVGSALEAEGNGEDGPIFNQGNGLGNVFVSLDADVSNDNARGESSFSGATTTGTVISGDIGYDDTQTFNGEAVCAFFGEVSSG